MSETEKCLILSLIWGVVGSFCALNMIYHAVRAALLYGVKP